jgi:uncharacterized protein YcbX
MTGKVRSLWRYPVKSMLGEELDAAAVSRKGLLGDRCYAVVDAAEGKVASAKSPRKWAKLFDCEARLGSPPVESEVAPVRITLPDKTVVSSEQSDIDHILSRELGRDVSLRSIESGRPAATHKTHKGELSGSDSLSPEGSITNEAVTKTAFFDAAVVHVVTTATLELLARVYPRGRFDARRFRSNVVLEVDGESGFVEDDWLGRTLQIGEEVRLGVTEPCPRCVMVNLPQKDLPGDPGILRAVARHNNGNAGVYATVLQGGRISVNDRIALTS